MSLSDRSALLVPFRFVSRYDRNNTIQSQGEKRERKDRMGIAITPYETIKEIFESADGEPGVSTSTTHAREIEKVTSQAQVGSG